MGHNTKYGGSWIFPGRSSVPLRGNQAGINTCWYPFSFSPLVPFPSHHTNNTDKLNLTSIFYLGKPLFPLSVAVRLIYVIHTLFNSCPNIRVNSAFCIVNMDRQQILKGHNETGQGIQTFHLPCFFQMRHVSHAHINRSAKRGLLLVLSDPECTNK